MLQITNAVQDEDRRAELDDVVERELDRRAELDDVAVRELDLRAELDDAVERELDRRAELDDVAVRRDAELERVQVYPVVVGSLVHLREQCLRK